MWMKNRMFMVTVALFAVMMIVSCGGPEQKKAKFYNKGRVLYEKGEYAKARLEFSNAIQIDVKYADAYYMLGMTALKSGDPRAASGSFSKAVELNPQHWEAQVQVGWFLLAGGNANDAMNKAELVLKNKPAYEDALILKGAVLLKKKELEAARQFFESVLGRDVHKPEGYLMLTSIYAQKNDAQNVERVLLDGIKDNQKAVPLYLSLADFYIKKNRMDEAVSQVQKVIELEPEVTQHRLSLAGIYWQSGREQQARDVLRAFVQADPKKEDRWVQAAQFYFTRKRPSDGEELLKEGIRQNGKSFTIRFVLGAFYFADNRPDQGLAVLQECLGLDRDPANPNILHAKNSLAEYYLTHQDLDKAKKYVDEVIKESPKNVDANFIAGTIHLRKQEALQAVSSFRTVVNERQQFIPGYVGLADAHLLNKEYKLAFDTLQNALKIEPDFRETIRAMARVYTAQKDFKNAEAQYRKLLTANPMDLDARADLGDLMLLAGDERRAEGEYLEIKRHTPKNPAIYVKLSALYGTQKKWGKAINEMEQAVQIQPDLWSTTNDLAYLLCEYGSGKQDLDRALALAEKARSLNPDNPTVLDTLGWVHYRKGDMQQAVELLKKAQDGSAGNPIINYHLGMAYNRLGNPEKAKQFLQTALVSKVAFPGRDEAEKTMAAIR
ncbi:MAG TPA: tetratricopeptide repeat protein [Nitrospirota bacterium]|nr:tetratricopeptide repeat protein [Nitrospirota bacterium]